MGEDCTQNTDGEGSAERASTARGGLERAEAGVTATETTRLPSRYGPLICPGEWDMSDRSLDLRAIVLRTWIRNVRKTVCTEKGGESPCANPARIWLGSVFRANPGWVFLGSPIREQSAGGTLINGTNHRHAARSRSIHTCPSEDRLCVLRLRAAWHAQNDRK